MPCIPFKQGRRVGFTCFAGPVYQFDGFLFENHRYFGPQKLNKDYDPVARQGPVFYAAVARWEALSKREREKCRMKG